MTDNRLEKLKERLLGVAGKYIASAETARTPGQAKVELDAAGVAIRTYWLFVKPADASVADEAPRFVFRDQPKFRAEMDKIEMDLPPLRGISAPAPTGWRWVSPDSFPGAIAALAWPKPGGVWLWAYIEHTPNGPMLYYLRGMTSFQPMPGNVAAWLLAEYARIAATWETHTDGPG